MLKEVTRAQFLKTRPARDHDDERHWAGGAVCVWKDGDKITHEEHQPDIGRVTFHVAN